MDDTSMHKIQGLINDGARVAVGLDTISSKPGLRFRACSSWEEGFELEREDCSSFCRCKGCKTFYFMGDYGDWSCPSCGRHDGDDTCEWLLNGEGDILGYHVFPYDDSEKIMEKVKQAVAIFKQARFEHGETPEVLSA